jgi:uncharacterized protein YbjT (DUF2867 family)
VTDAGTTTAPILVTGGTGSLGRLLVPRLTAAGRTVRVLSRSPHDNVDGGEFVTGDLVTGAGIVAAVAGVATIVHCASSYKGDPVAARHLVQAATVRPGVSHLVYVSIVGIDAAPITGLARGPFGYVASKLEVEGIVKDSGIPWTTLRATQFFSLIFSGARALTRLPVVPVPGGPRFQPVDVEDVAERLAPLALGDPVGRAPDIGGPEVMTFAELIHTYLRVSHRHRLVLPIPAPGRFARAMRNGAFLVPADLQTGAATGRRTWAQYVADQLL